MKLPGTFAILLTRSALCATWFSSCRVRELFEPGRAALPWVVCGCCLETVDGAGNSISSSFDWWERKDEDSGLVEDECADPDPTERPRPPDELTAILTTLFCCEGVLISLSPTAEALAFSSMMELSALTTRSCACEFARDACRRFEGSIGPLTAEAVLFLPEVLLSRTMRFRFRTGLFSLLALPWSPAL